MVGSLYFLRQVKTWAIRKAGWSMCKVPMIPRTYFQAWKTLGKSYIFHGADQIGQGSSADVRLQVKKFPKRTDFLHRVPADAMEKLDDFIFLDPEDCRIERMPVIYAQFATYIPSIMHNVENALLTDHLHNGVLAPIRFSGQAVVFPAI